VLAFPQHAAWRKAAIRIPTSTTSRSTDNRAETSTTILDASSSPAESDLTLKADQRRDEGPEETLPAEIAQEHDNNSPHRSLPATEFVGMIEDILAMKKSIAVAYGFRDIHLPPSSRELESMASEKSSTRYVDLWPIQLSPSTTEAGWETYTLILQLGTILSFVPSWRYRKVGLFIITFNVKLRNPFSFE
jgi:hypothetical protein